MRCAAAMPKRRPKRARTHVAPRKGSAVHGHAAQRCHAARDLHMVAGLPAIGTDTRFADALTGPRSADGGAEQRRPLAARNRALAPPRALMRFSDPQLVLEPSDHFLSLNQDVVQSSL